MLAAMGEHESLEALRQQGLEPHAQLCDMLDERYEHRTERRGCGYTQATRLLAAQINQRTLIALPRSRVFGFHHAHPDTGGGFCVFNGLALVAHARPTLKVAVLDCDEHGGDGTEAFAKRLINLHTFSVFGSRFGVRSPVELQSRRYLQDSGRSPR